MDCYSECIFAGSAELSSRCERPSSSCRKTEEGVGALELLDGVLLDDLADGVALADDVVAGVEPREGEVAVGAALEMTRVDVYRLALAHGCITFSTHLDHVYVISNNHRSLLIKEELTTHTIFFCHGCEDPHDQGGLQAQEHQERAALHGRFAWRFSYLQFPVQAFVSCVLACCAANSAMERALLIGVQI